MAIKQYVIGFDPGNGNTNAATRVGRELTTISLQSSVARPVEIGDVAKGFAKTKAAPCVLVEWDTDQGRERYMVGPGAWLEGVPTSIVLGDLYHTLPRRALLYAALAEMLPPGTRPEHHEVTLVFGLPTNVLANEKLAGMVKTGLTTLKGTHRFTVAGKPYAFTVPDIKGSIQAINQPFGAYLDWQLDDDLQPARQARSVLVFDIGMGTADIAGLLIQDGGVTPSKDAVMGEDLGVNWLLRTLVQERGLDLAAVDADLRAGRLKLSGDQLDTWLNRLLKVLREREINLKRFEVVIPTGGGALLLGERLRLTLAAAGANVHWNPARFLDANVRGYWKFGQRRAAQLAAKANPVASVAVPVA